MHEAGCTHEQMNHIIAIVDQGHKITLAKDIIIVLMPVHKIQS